jgi:hypothetical protein
MRILEVKPRERIEIEEEFNQVYCEDDEIIINFINPSHVTYTSVRIDGSDYPMFDVDNPVQLLQFMCDLRDYIDNMDDTRVFGDEETFINVIDSIESTINEIKSDCTGEEEEEQEQDDGEMKFRVMNTMNMVAGIPYSSINWDQNSENLDDLEEAMDVFHQKIAEMMAGEIDFTEVLDTAESVLNNVGMPTDYTFPNAKNVSRREMAILKMFDAYAIYAKLFAYTGMYLARKETVSQFQDIISQLGANDSGVDEDVSDVYEASDAINNGGEKDENDC